MKKELAKNLINYKRLDIVVKYLYAKEILESKNNDYSTGIYKDLYIRHILMRNMGIEPQREYEKNNKISVDNFCKDFEELLFNIEKNGYDLQQPIRIGKNKLPENGAHRIAIGTLLNNEVSIEEVEQGWEWNFDWFCQNGFNTEDKQRILKGFVDIHSEKCGIFVVWNPLFKYIDNVKAVINHYFDIVGDVELDFEDNYIAFTNALLEIYEPNISLNGDETTIREKARLLQANYLSFKVIVVTNQEKNSDKTISELSKICKDEIRNLFNHLLPKECFCTVHSSDGVDETVYLSNILLSPNNIKHLKMRNSTETNFEFVKKIRFLPNFLKTVEIKDTSEICIIGSSILNAICISNQKISDIDFIITSNYRERFGWNAINLNSDYDIGISDKMANRPKNISDNILITNNEYHFWFKGIKFANLEIIKDRMKISAREKDIRHLREIDLFEKMIGNINQQKILMQRIEDEKQRRSNLLNTNIEPISFSYSNFFERIFSVKNHTHTEKYYKIITIFGIKLKFRRNK